MLAAAGKTKAPDLLGPGLLTPMRKAANLAGGFHGAYASKVNHKHLFGFCQEKDGPVGSVSARRRIDFPGLVAFNKQSARAKGKGRPFSWDTDLIGIDPALSRISRLQTAVKLAARQHEAEAQGWKSAMITLTYRNGVGADSWQPSHIRDFLNTARKWLRRRGHPLRYTWVGELQRRGVVHYHVLIWLPPMGRRHVKLPKPDVAGWWRYGHTEIAWARCPVPYLTKYASKCDKNAGSHTFPKGLRLHGSGGMSATAKAEIRYQKRPAWFRDAVPSAAEIWRPADGGGFANAAGDVIRSPNEIVFQGGRISVGRRTTIAALRKRRELDTAVLRAGKGIRRGPLSASEQYAADAAICRQDARQMRAAVLADRYWRTGNIPLRHAVVADFQQAVKAWDDTLYPMLAEVEQLADRLSTEPQLKARSGSRWRTRTAAEARRAGIAWAGYGCPF